MRNLRFLRTLETTAVLLFLIQSLRVLFSVLFGVIYDVIFAETVAFSTLGVIMLFVIGALLTPLATPRRRERVLLLGTALVAALARIPLTINLPAVRLLSGILIVGASGMYAVTALRRRPRTFTTGLVLAFAADQLLRAAGNTFDVGLRSWWLPVQVVLSLATCGVAWLAFSRPQADPPPRGSIGLVSGLALGALLFLQSSILGFPNALARWSGMDYAIVAPLLMGITLLPVLPSVQKMASRLPRAGLGRLGLLSLTVAGLAAGRVVGGAAGLAGMLLGQFLLLLAPLGRSGPRRRERAGVALALGFLLFLLLTFSFAFTFTYPYTIPTFRGMGLPVVLAAAATASLPALCSAPAQGDAFGGECLGTKHQRLSRLPRRDNRLWLPAAVVVVLTAAFAQPPALALKESGPLRVGTYNMHYGYNTPWQLNLEAQARTIEESGADVVMLQEVDACRVTSYGVDDALWLARRLRMQEVYGPALEGLSGCALLSRFPITEAETRLLTSHLEQTSIVHARLRIGDRPLDAYAIWLGLEPEERARQLDDALAIIGDASPAVFGGDFNSTPDSPVYARIRAAGFEDQFVVGGFDPAPTSPAIEPMERIDFVWARGLEVREAQVLDSLASDHRMVVVELEM